MGTRRKHEPTAQEILMHAIEVSEQLGKLVKKYQELIREMEKFLGKQRRG